MTFKSSFYTLFTKTDSSWIIHETTKAQKVKLFNLVSANNIILS